MAELQIEAWPPQPIATDRLVLRAPEASDRDSFIGLLTSPVARQYLGGPIDQTAVEAAASGSPGRTPGSFVAALKASGAFVGTVGLDRRDSERPGHVHPDGLDLEISYALEPTHWGLGYAGEAVKAVLAWAARTLPDEFVVACTQTANHASTSLLQRLGFTERERFTEFAAEQSLWSRPLTAKENP